MKNLLGAFLFIFILCTSCIQKPETMQTFDPTFVHTVYFWFKEPKNQDHKQKFEASLNKFLNASQYAKTNYIGTPPKSTRDVVDDSFSYALIVTFESAEAQQKYQDEEAHSVFIEECKDLWEKVIVYDSNGI